MFNIWLEYKQAVKGACQWAGKVYELQISIRKFQYRKFPIDWPPYALQNCHWNILVGLQNGQIMFSTQCNRFWMEMYWIVRYV